MNFRRRAKKKKRGPRLLSYISVKPLVYGQQPDYKFLIAVLGLLIFGWVLVYSSSALFAESRFHDQFFFLKRQILWSFVGLGAFLIAMNVPLSLWQKSAKLIYVLTLSFLILVLFFGPQIAGARRWLRFGMVNFQPSELAKLSLVLYAADYMDRRQSRLRDFKRGLVPLLFSLGLIVLLILLEPDLGTPVLMAIVLLVLLLMGGARFSHLLAMGMSLVSAASIAIFSVRYRWDRFLAYLNPWSDPYGKGYQLIQSLLALGSGGIFGRGLGNSRIKIANLPEAHTDFVFSVLGEELGLIGTLTVVALFLFIVLRGLRIAQKAPTTFGMLTATGLSLMIGFQGAINMGVACGLLPTKGMPLPFLSFGGSSLVITLVSIGILTNISKSSKSPSTGAA